MNDKSVSALALLGLSLWFIACGKTANYTDIDAPPNNVTSGAGSGNEAGGGGSTIVAASVTSGASGVSGTGDPCVPGIAVTSQIPRLLNRQYDAILRDLLGVTTVASADGQKPSDLLVGDDGDRSAAMNAPAWQTYQNAGAKIAREVMTGPNKSKFISCDPSAAGCLDQTIKTFGRKAFRRPLTAAEVARFQKLAQATPAPTADELAETTLFAFLVSPSFLLLPELQSVSDPATSGISLSSYEVATRLALLIWGSVPDDVLNAAADADQLVTEEQVRAQAQRMGTLRDKAEPLVTAFHRSWLHMDDPSNAWWKVRHDPAQYPLYSDAAQAAEQAGLDALIADIAFRGGSFQDLLLNDTAFVNQDNAAIYDLDPSEYGAELQRVELDATQRPGLLTRAGFLSSYASYAQTNPPKRGDFLAQDMLGIPLGAPIPGAITATLTGDFATQRDYFTALTSSTDCQTCHSVINPFGFALENFDAIGKWQTVDRRGGPIDATATIDFGDGVKQSIRSPLELMQRIATSPKAERIYAQSWVSYAFGRPANAYDACIVDSLTSKIALGNYELIGVLPELAQAPSFRERMRGSP